MEDEYGQSFSRYTVDDVTRVDAHHLCTLRRRSRSTNQLRRVCIFARCTRATVHNIQRYKTYHESVVESAIKEACEGNLPLQFVYDLRGGTSDDWMGVMQPLLDVHTKYKPVYPTLLRGTAILVDSRALTFLLNTLFSTVYTPLWTRPHDDVARRDPRLESTLVPKCRITTNRNSFGHVSVATTCRRVLKTTSRSTQSST